VPKKDNNEPHEEAADTTSSFGDYGVAVLCAGDDTVVTNTTTTTTTISDEPSLQCAICLSVPTRSETDFSEFRHLTSEENIQTTTTSTTRSTVCHKEGFAHLPCCGGTDGKTEQTTSTKICTSCLLLLCSSTSDDGQTHIGKCPRCRSWISLTSSSSSSDLVTISPTTSRAGECQVCFQTKLLLLTDDTNNNNRPLCCDACYLGMRHPLLYECQLCVNVQRIPHPMYRYQLHPREFGNDTWACQQRNCQTFTKWRILASQLPLIPPGDVPESWGEDVIMEMTRARVVVVAQQRRNADQQPHAAEGGWSTGCRIS